MDDVASDNNIFLEYLLHIWPIVSSLASQSSAGDLISLSRASSTFRYLTHAFPPDREDDDHHLTTDPSQNNRKLHIGTHQTPHWSALKSLAPFTCSAPSHKEPRSTTTTTTTGPTNNPIRPCKHCSRPICKTCIVRSFFEDPTSSKNTFRYRTRYLCRGCWDGGNLRRDFRYPAEGVSREQVWRGRGYGQRGGACSCSASEENWVCRECRLLQNLGGPENETLGDARRGSSEKGSENRESVENNVPVLVQCYGLGCDNTINEVGRDRRRICLWCSKGLSRQFGGEDRLRWEEKQVEVRAAAAAARSADIGEWARNRFKTLTMSRRQMRGTEACILLTSTDGPEHDQPIFVRHLDAVNYRQFLRDRAVPDPARVYESKHGRWVYSRGFLEGINRQRGRRFGHFGPFGGDEQQRLSDLTRENGLKAARRNSEVQKLAGPLTDARSVVLIHGAHLVEAGIIEQEEVDVHEGLEVSGAENARLVRALYDQLEKWEDMDEVGRKDWRPLMLCDLLSGSNGTKRRLAIEQQRTRRQELKQVSRSGDSGGEEARKLQPVDVPAAQQQIDRDEELVIALSRPDDSEIPSYEDVVFADATASAIAGAQDEADIDNISHVEPDYDADAQPYELTRA